MTVFVTEISMKKSEIAVKWEQPNEATHEADRFSLVSTEPTMPVFAKAWAEMKKYFRQMLELPADYVEKLNFDKIKIERNDEMITFKMFGSRALKNSKGGISEITPWFSYDTKTDKDQSGKQNRMSKACYEELIHLQEKALLYVEGERAQLELFTNDEPVAEDLILAK